jgi:hypothetical protein
MRPAFATDRLVSPRLPRRARVAADASGPGGDLRGWFHGQAVARRRRASSRCLLQASSFRRSPAPRPCCSQSRTGGRAVRSSSRLESGSGSPRRSLSQPHAARLTEEALTDELRLQGSSIANADELLDRLRRAVVEITPAAAGFLLKPPRQPAPAPPDATQPSATPSPAAGPTGSPKARLVPRSTRGVINEFRADARDGVVRARNRSLQPCSSLG